MLDGNVVKIEKREEENSEGVTHTRPPLPTHYTNDETILDFD